MFGRGLAADLDGRLWAEGAVVFAAQKWIGCYAACWERRCSASDDKPIVVTAGRYDVAVNNHIRIYPVGYVAAERWTCDSAGAAGPR